MRFHKCSVCRLSLSEPVDASFFADPTYLAQYERLPDSHVERVRLSGFGDLIFNTQRSDLVDARVRRAIARAIDIPRLVRNATRGAQSSAQAGRGLFGWAYDPTFGPPKYDPSTVSLQFERAGWRRGGDGMLSEHGRPLLLVLAFPSGSATYTAIAVDLQAELRRAGISLTLHAYTPTLFRAPSSAGGPLFGGKFDLAFLEVFAASDPDTQWYLGCAQIPPHGFNLQRF